jgi:amino acid adenylation domain-containing protein
MDKQQLSILSGKRTSENQGKTLVQLFRESAAAFGENIAVVYEDISITYGELDRMTDRMAAALLKKGVKRGDRVGLLVERNELVPICLFGVMKAGAAYVPLDPAYPVNRLLYMIEDADLACVIADMQLIHSIEGYAGKTLDARAIQRAADEIGEAPQLTDPEPDDLMAVMYTSGSTGMPKGVMLGHKTPISYTTYYRNLHGLTDSDAVTSYAGFSFVVHMFDFYPALISGATVHIISDDIRLDTAAVNRYMHENNITVSFLPTAFGHVFAVREKNTSLRSLTMAGEMFIPFDEMPSGYTVYNAYGSTECLIVSTARIRPGIDNVTAGGPIDNFDLYVVGEDGNLAPVGEEGDLCVSGPAVGLGYRNLPERTAHVFLDNPFSSEPGFERMYRMGDICRVT